MIELPDAVLGTLVSAQCQELLAWAQGGEEPLDRPGGLRWLLAHCDDGVVWGYREGGPWVLSHTAFPEVSPPLLAETLQELRLFGEDEERFVWKGTRGLAGRRLADAGEPAAARWMSDQRVLVGNQLREGPKEGFTLVADGGGTRHAVPLECAAADFAGGLSPLRLELRHYLQSDDATGAVRVAATRLVRVYREEKAEGSR